MAIATAFAITSYASRFSDPLNIAVVGAGALGSVYAHRLQQAGADVGCIVREAHALPAWTKRRSFWDAPPVQCDLPTMTEASSADLILLAVRGEQIDAALLGQLRTPHPHAHSLVCLTPLMPGSRQRLQSLGIPLCCALPNLVALRIGTGVEYWQPPLSCTRLEAGTGAHGARVRQLAELLSIAGLDVRLQRDVFWPNVALTTSFFPLSYALHAHGSLDALCRDPHALSSVAGALTEAVALARDLGPVPWLVRGLARVARPSTLLSLARLASTLAPRGVEFLNLHFGVKLAAQHEVLAAEILALGVERAVPMPHLEQLVGRLAFAPP